MPRDYEDFVERNLDRSARHPWLAIGFVCAVAVATPIACSYMATVSTVATAPSRVVNRTLNTSNIIQNYEWFFDVNAQYQARTAQIAQQQKYLDDETDADERRRLRMELAAMQQSCRDLATQYNANSLKQNRDLFKSRGLPETLSCAS